MKSVIAFLFLLFLSPNDYQTFLKKGDELHKKFDNINAAKQYEEAYKLAPGDYYVLQKLTMVYNDLGEEYVELSRRSDEEKGKSLREEAKNILIRQFIMLNYFKRNFRIVQ